MLKILYISSIGLTDPIASSQIIPYFIAFQREGIQVVTISREGEENYQKYHTSISSLLASVEIQWHPIFRQKGLKGTFRETRNLRKKALELHKKEQFDIVHCRSYMPALTGQYLKKRFDNLKFVFDMRGFWPDERVEGKIWKLSNPAYHMLYKFFKYKERSFFRDADYNVSLTHVGKEEIESWKLKPSKPIEVIPCCADFDHFDYSNIEKKDSLKVKQKLGLNKEDFVLLYLGSVGTWYALDEMFSFFSLLKRKKPNCKFVILSASDEQIIKEAASRQNIDSNDFVVTRVSKHELPSYLSIADLSIVFYYQNYSRKGCSPTKIAELMGMGIPIVTSGNIGDTDHIINETKSGIIVPEFTKEAFDNVLNNLEKLLDTSKTHIRTKGLEYFSLNDGIRKYLNIYSQLLN